MRETIAAALEAQRHEYESDFDSKNEPLQFLIDQVDVSDQLDIGATLLLGSDAQERILGARLLREVGDGRSEAGRLVAAAILDERDDDVLGWLVSALRFVGDPSVISVLLPLTDHSDDRVRDQVAGAISSSAGPELGELEMEALLRLAGDTESEVRFSALFELGEWFKAGTRDSRVESLLRDALDASDQQLRVVASDALADAE